MLLFDSHTGTATGYFEHWAECAREIVKPIY